MGIAAVLAAVSLVASPASFVTSRQQADGGFAEVNGSASPELTAWAALGLHASRSTAGNALSYLVAHEHDLSEATSIALVALAESALGGEPGALLSRLRDHPRQVNEAIWNILAQRQAGRPLPTTVVRYLLASQARSGGFSWARGLRPDSNDTAFAIQALRAAGIRGKPVIRAIAFLRNFEQRDGGFELTRGRGPDAQSTAVAIQAFVAAGVKPPARAFSYLARLRQQNGSYRYSVRYAATPVWVTSQVLPALARKPFPLR